MGNQTRSDTGSMLACIAQTAPDSTLVVEELRYPIVGRAMTKIWAREHSRAVEQRNRSMLMVVEESGRRPLDGG